MMDKNKKVLVIALDGLDWELINKFKNELPTFRKIIEQGISGPMESVEPLSSVPAWPCFYTGNNPGKTGVFSFHQRKSGSYQQEIINSTYVKSEAIWDILTRHDKSSIVVNVPFTYPTRKIKGIMITGLTTPPHKKDYVYPLEIKKDIENVCNGYIIGTNLDAFLHQDRKNMLTYFKKMVEKRTVAMKYLLKNHPWSFAMIVYWSMDPISHFLWHTIDSKDSPVKEFLQFMDDKIKELLEIIDEQTTLFLMSDHGMGPRNYDFFINNWLIEKGYLKLKKDAKIHGFDISLFKIVDFFKKMKMNKLVGLMGEYIPTSLVEKIVPLRNESRDVSSSKLIDWENSQAYSPTAGFIYLNIKGREPRGIVDLTKDYNRVRETIINDLKSTIDPRNGNKIIERIFCKEEIYSGEYMDKAPDIIFSTEGLGYSIPTALGNNTFCDVDKNKPGWAAFHRINGMYAIYGNNIQKNVDIKSGILDFCPTILHALDLPVPSGVDGKVIDCFKEKKAIEYENEQKRDFSVSRFSKQEREGIDEELKKLGYLK